MWLTDGEGEGEAEAATEGEAEAEAASEGECEAEAASEGECEAAAKAGAVSEGECEAADLEVFALNEEPQAEWCQRDHRGLGTCYQQVDQGVTGLSIIPANEGASGFAGVTLPITLNPLSGEDSSCAAFTVQKCCAGSPGISAVACYVSPPCGCPDGTTSGARQADGTIMGTCP